MLIIQKKTNTMLNMSRWLLVCLLPFLFLACKENTTETEPQLPVTRRLNRVLVYQNSATEMRAEYENTSLNYAAEESGTQLRLSFFTNYPAGSDGISFQIPVSRLVPGRLGVYTLGSLPNPSTGAAQLDYRFAVSNTRTAIYQSGTTRVEGSLEITAYNAAKKTISGTYTVRLPDVFDPFDTAMIPARRCTFTITGTFANVPVTQQP